MSLQTINPATGETLATYEEMTSDEVRSIIGKVHEPNSGSWSRIAWFWDISSTVACRIRPPVNVVADRVGGL